MHTKEGERGQTSFKPSGCATRLHYWLMLLCNRDSILWQSERAVNLLIEFFQEILSGSYRNTEPPRMSNLVPRVRLCRLPTKNQNSYWLPLTTEQNRTRTGRRSHRGRESRDNTKGDNL